ncbi:MAG: septal ring lytic transglycosylase RlpA family protein [Hyphomonadaceae bacterium]
MAQRLLILALACFALAANAAAQERASYGYGTQQPRDAPGALDMRRNSRPDAGALAQAPELDGADEEDEPALVQEVQARAPANAQLEPAPEQEGSAGWYGGESAGGPTASGETFDPNALTAAHASFPLPSLAQITNLENNRQIVVRVNDRTAPGNLIDVSRRAAEELGFHDAGEARVRVRWLGPAPRQLAAVEQEGPLALTPPPAAEEEEELAGAPMAPLVRQPPPAPPPQPTPEPQRAAAAAGFMVQVGAFADLTNAHRVQADLSSIAAVTIEPTMAGDTELFRVRLGPWASRSEAEIARQQAAARGYPAAIVAPR